MDICLSPVGYVSNAIKEKMRHGWGTIESTITIDPDLAPSLDGIEDFSHIIILFWMHQATGDSPVKVHPQGKTNLPLTGVFATRAPHRPNSIGMTVVKLLDRNENVLKVMGLDAIDGSPVLDIKPYLPKDRVDGSHHPDWVSMLDHS